MFDFGMAKFAEAMMDRPKRERIVMISSWAHLGWAVVFSLCLWRFFESEGSGHEATLSVIFLFVSLLFMLRARLAMQFASFAEALEKRCAGNTDNVS